MFTIYHEGARVGASKASNHQSSLIGIRVTDSPPIFKQVM